MCIRAALGMHSRVSQLYVYKGCARHAFKGEPTVCVYKGCATHAFKGQPTVCV